MKASISVVIPTYNYGRFVCDAVESALRQTLPPLEIIVVDDGSIDDTQQRLRTYGDRIYYVYRKNGGLSAARNTGITLSRGEWVAILDSDDIWHAQKLERLWAAHDLRPEIRAWSADFEDFLETEGFTDPTISFSGEPRIQSISTCGLVYGVHFSGGSGAMIHRECFAKVGMFDESLRSVEDLDMWLRIAAEFRMARVLETLVFVRTHSTSMSTVAVTMEANHRKVIQKTFGSLPHLRENRFWKHVALARMHRGVAWMHYQAGNRANALRSLWRSFIACPLTSGRTEPFIRLRMAARFLLG